MILFFPGLGNFTGICFGINDSISIFLRQCVCSFFFKNYLFIYLVALGLSCGKEGSLVVAGGLLSCSMYVGSSSLTRDQTQAPCIGSMES